MHESTSTLRVGLLWLLGVSAGVTVLTHIAQLLKIPFWNYANNALIVALFVSLMVLIASIHHSFSVAVRDSRVLFLVLVIAAAGAVLALVINRPDADDYYYVPNAVYYLQHPSEPMGFNIHYLSSGGTPFTSLFWATAGPYEYAQAALAFLLRLDYLVVYYIVAAAIVGFLIPISFFLATTHFSSSTRNAAIGTLVFVFLALLLVGTHRTFGNLSFARAFQGKMVLFSVGIPLFVSFSLDYFKRPTLLSWAMLFLLSTSMIGVTSSATWLLPMLALVLGLSYAVATGGPARTFANRLPYFISLLYPLLFAAYTLSSSVSTIGSDSIINQGWPTTFMGHARLVINPFFPLTLIVLVVSITISLIFLSQKRRRFLICWMILSMLLLLNPLVAPTIIRFVTTPNAYWRLFYVFPFPLTIAIGVASLLDTKDPLLTGKRRLAPVALLAVAASMGLVFRMATDSRESSVSIGPPAYKLPLRSLAIARQALIRLPPGMMLAPSEIAGITAMLNSEYPQLRIREDAVRLWLSETGRPNDAEIRIGASDFVGGQSGDFLALAAILGRYSELQSVIVKQDILADSEVDELLSIHGFSFRGYADEYALLSR